MIKTFVDTSFVIAIVNRGDQHHEKANELVAVFDTLPLVTTDAVLLEIGNSLSRDFKIPAISVLDEFIESARIEIVRLDQHLFDHGFDLFKQYPDKAWGLVDCISFVVMRENGITDALTSDRHFAQAGFRALMREPVN